MVIVQVEKMLSLPRCLHHFSKNMGDHLKDGALIVYELQSSGITIKLKKCEWFTDTIKYVDHLVKSEKLEIDEVVTAAICKATMTRTQTPTMRLFGSI